MAVTNVDGAGGNRYAFDDTGVAAQDEAGVFWQMLASDDFREYRQEFAKMTAEKRPTLKKASPVFVSQKRWSEEISIVDQHGNWCVRKKQTELLEHGFSPSKELHPMVDERGFAGQRKILGCRFGHFSD